MLLALLKIDLALNGRWVFVNGISWWMGNKSSFLLCVCSTQTGRAGLCWGPGSSRAWMWAAPMRRMTGSLGLAPSCCPRVDRRMCRPWPSCCRNSWRPSIRRSSKEVWQNSTAGRKGGNISIHDSLIQHHHLLRCKNFPSFFKNLYLIFFFFFPYSLWWAFVFIIRQFEVTFRLMGLKE